MCTWMHLKVMLYVHCLPCYFCTQFLLSSFCSHYNFTFFLFQILNFLSSSHFIWSGHHHISGELLSNSQVMCKYKRKGFFFGTCLKNIGLWLWLTVETTFFSDSAVAEAVIHWLSITVVSVQSQGSLHWIYAGESGSGIDFSPST